MFTLKMQLQLGVCASRNVCISTYYLLLICCVYVCACVYMHKFIDTDTYKCAYILMYS